MQVRYQAALRPDEARDSNRGAPPGGSPSAQYFQNSGDFCAQRADVRSGNRWRRRDRGRRLGIMFKTLARTADGEALLVQQFADAADQQHLVVLIVAPVAAPLDRAQLGEFLFPVTQHVRLDGAQLRHFTDGEIAFGRDRREFSPGWWAIQFGRLRPGT